MITKTKTIRNIFVYNVFFSLIFLLHGYSGTSQALPYSPDLSEPEKRGKQAWELSQQGKHDEALEILNTTIKDFPKDFSTIQDCIFLKAKIYKKQKQYDKAIEAVQSLRTVWKEPDIHGMPSEVILDGTIYNQLKNIYLEMGEFELALDACARHEEAVKLKFNKFSKEPESRRKLGLLQVGPASYASIYEKWGKYDMARQKLQEEIDWLSQPDIKKEILDKLEPRKRLAWAFNRDVRYPVLIAELYLKEGKKGEAKELLLKIQPLLEKPEYKIGLGELSPSPSYYYKQTKKKVEVHLKNLQKIDPSAQAKD